MTAPSFFRDDPWTPQNPNNCQLCKLEILQSEKGVHTDDGIMHTHCAITRYRQIVPHLTDALVDLTPKDTLTAIVESAPTVTVFVSDLRTVVKQADVHELLIVKRAFGVGALKHTLVHVWKRML